MRKLKEGYYLLDTIELGALTSASIEEATRELHRDWYDPRENGLPAIVDEAYHLLHGSHIFAREHLAGSLVPSVSSGLIEKPTLYQAVSDAFHGCAVEVHAIYRPDNNYYPGWLLAAVDLFRAGQTYKVYFSNEGDGQVRIEDICRWKFG